jgi:hypothetical protein
MLGSMVLEVAIGLIFVYLLLSFIVTAVTELISGWRKWRAKNLWEGVRQLVDSGTAEEWVTKLYDHPLIQGLSREDTSSNQAQQKGKGPSYIPSRTFAVSLVETLKSSDPAGQLAIKALRQAVDTTPDSASVADFKAALRNAVKDLPATGAIGELKGEALALIDRLPDTVPLTAAKNDARAWLAKLPDRWLQMLIENLPDSKLKRSLTAILDEAHRDLDHFKTNVEVWFNNSMERVSGWYKRKTQIVHVLLAAIVTVVINVDTVLVVNALSQNQALRDSVVAEAEAYAKNAPAPASTAAPQPAPTPPTDASSVETIQSLRKQLAQLDLPVGWILPGQRSYDPENRDFRLWPGIRPHKGTWQQWVWLWLSTIRFHLLGWLVTAAAISLGAPFWFDMLNKVINIRSAGRAPEEAPKPPQAVPQPQEPGQTPAPAS